MAKKVKSAPGFNLDAARIEEMAGLIRTNADDVNAEVTLHGEAKAAEKAAGVVVNSKRVKIMQVMADLAIAGNWLPAEIDAAAAIAAKDKDNGGPKLDGSLKTFLYEICYAAHPMVRDNFRTLNEVVELAWRNEIEQNVITNKASPTPIAKWAKRKYHALTGAMKAAIKGVSIQSESDLIAYAKDNDPDEDVGKVFKRFEKLVADLRGFNVDFPVDDLGLGITTLEGITVGHFTAAKARKDALAQESIQEIRESTPTPAPTPAPAPVAPVIPTPEVSKPSPFVTHAPAPVPAPVKDALNEFLGDEMDVDNLMGDNLDYSAMAAA